MTGSQLNLTDVVLDCDSPNTELREIIDRQSGYVERNLAEVPFGSQYGVRKFPDSLLLSWDAIEALTKERYEKRERASDLLIGQKIPATHQGQTNFCWYHSAVQPMRTWRAKRGLPFVDLCAAYGACRVQNFRNEGYWTTAAVADLTKFGTVDTTAYPENEFSRSRHKEAASANHYFIADAVDIETYQQLCSVLVLDGQAGGGWSWMRHAMEIVEVVYDGGAACLRVRDNYGNGRGDNGMYVLTGRKAIPNDVVGILSVAMKPGKPDDGSGANAAN